MPTTSPTKTVRRALANRLLAIASERRRLEARLARYPGDFAAFAREVTLGELTRNGGTEGRPSTVRLDALAQLCRERGDLWRLHRLVFTALPEWMGTEGILPAAPRRLPTLPC